MAAAAITPRGLETAFSPASFPGVSFMVRSSPVSIYLQSELHLPFYTAVHGFFVTAVTPCIFRIPEIHFGTGLRSVLIAHSPKPGHKLILAPASSRPPIM
jgi:hypothetical protein